MTQAGRKEKRARSRVAWPVLTGELKKAEFAELFCVLYGPIHHHEELRGNAWQKLKFKMSSAN
jgi:hypothetical protein